MPSTNELRQQITNRIVEALETGNLPPWRKPWRCDPNAGMPTNVVSKKRYSGINVLLLESAAMRHGFESKFWATYKQWSQLGGQVKKRPADIDPGHWGTTIVFWSQIKKTGIDDTGEEIDKRFYMMKTYTVFNVDQVEGLPPHFYATAAPTLAPADRIAHAEAFFAATAAEIRHGGNRAYYAIGSDQVQVPRFECFADPESYYATLGHELCHWTRHPSRLDRDFGRKRWGDEGYAREELVAELGAAFLCADLGLALTPRPDHASYLKSWLEVLKGDKRFIFTAAAHAQRACDHLHSLQPRKGAGGDAEDLPFSAEQAAA